MSVVDKKYERLAPRATYLRDVAVLAQAWKKTHTYIRRYSWYADTLELDCSAVCLDARISQWAADLAAGTYRPTPAWLVPAPKSGLWSFSSKHAGGWAPHKQEGAGDDLVLRPLAHLGIREQTIASAVMLCLADCVESAQGDPAEPAGTAASKGIYSYGNRLFCSWSNRPTLARFSWGNSNTYSRYFQDYQRFVERPTASALQAEQGKEEDEEVFIVKLDISAFFDNVDVDRLIHILRQEYERYASRTASPLSDRAFWRLAGRALKFEWREEDMRLAPLFRGKKLPNGLPQGLVSSGFFANAYMLPFDRSVGRAIGSLVMGTHEFQIHDYCRYVDDLRLVITARPDRNGEIDEKALAKSVSTWVQARLKRHTRAGDNEDAYLRLNGDKTELEPLGDIGGDSRTAQRMKALQQQLSGPFDVETLQQVETGLGGLLSLAELGLLEDQVGYSISPAIRLATVAKTKLEVRDDTLTRFSAYRLSRSLRMRRRMTDLTEKIDGKSALNSLQHDFEAAARRLVAAWAVNPSLVQVLRYALDLYPNAELLEPIAQALTSKLLAGGADSEHEERVVYYVLAELFKAGATETGQTSEEDVNFPITDVSAYRQALAALAQNVLELPAVPWYVQQQASLLLASVGQATTSIDAIPELRFHRALHSYLRLERADPGVEILDEVVISLVAYQMVGDERRYVTWFRRFAMGRRRTSKSEALKLIGELEPALFERIVSPDKSGSRAEASLAPKYLTRYINQRWREGAQPLPVGKWIALATVMSHPSAPLGQENALLKLALRLAEASWLKEVSPALLTPSSVELRCLAWNSINDPEAEVLNIRLHPQVGAPDPIYSTPSWCRPSEAWMYAIGRLLRAAATGEPDFTARHWLMRENAGRYQGIRSTWQKRRMGMLHTSAALRGSASAITPWFSDLLLDLLRWPGVPERPHSVLERASTPRALAGILKSRIEDQRRIYGKAAGLPIYRYPVEWPFSRKEGLRVVIVQGLMPMQRDFGAGLSSLSHPGYRERHRNHTAALLHLANKHLNARDYVLGRTEKPHVDLVIFPELTIHVDDQDLMRAFSDATGAILFYGLLGATSPGTTDPINAGRWLIPQRRVDRRSWIEVDQGKFYLTKDEEDLGVVPWRPYQAVIELCPPDGSAPFRLSGSICYDATDLSLAADLRDESHMYVIAAMNKDVKTFDGMIAALKYHMYQHVLIANIGEFGGSTAQAPYDQEHRRLISHAHGSEQLAIAVFDVRVEDFGPKLEAAQAGAPIWKTVVQRIGKTRPAGLKRRG